MAYDDFKSEVIMLIQSDGASGFGDGVLIMRFKTTDDGAIVGGFKIGIGSKFPQVPPGGLFYNKGSYIFGAQSYGLSRYGVQ